MIDDIFALRWLSVHMTLAPIRPDLTCIRCQLLLSRVNRCGAEMFSRCSYYYYYYLDVNLQNNDQTLSQSPHSSLGQNLSFFFDSSLTFCTRPQSPCILPLENDKALYQVLPLFIPNVESFLIHLSIQSKFIPFP